MNRVRLYLTSDKMCITIGQLLFAEGYNVARGKEQKAGRTYIMLFSSIELFLI